MLRPFPVGFKGGGVPFAGPSAELSVANSAVASSVAVNVPGGVVNGDLLVAFVGSTNAAPDLITGWTDSGLGAIGTAVVRGRWMWRVASSEPASYTFTTGGLANRVAAGITRITGANTTTPINISGSGSGTSGGDVIGPSITTTVDNTLPMVGGAHTLSTDFGAEQNGLTELWQRNQGGAGDPKCSAAVAAKEQVTAGASGVLSWDTNLASGNWVALSIAIAPAP